MCRLTVVNKLYLGNRELGYELYNDREIVEMTAIQLKNAIKAGKDVRGVVIDKATNELVLDKDGFYSVNMMKHSHINNYEPMIESDSKVNVFYIVMDKHTENDKSVYDLLSSRFERVTVSEDKLITYLELGLVSAGAKLENGKLLSAGGRVLGVTENAPTLAEAIDKAYATVKTVSFENAYYRTDIGQKALRGIK